MNIDPHATSYKALTPYNYVNNCPTNSIDPDGKDIIVLCAPNHVHNLGHAAVLIGNPGKGYYFYSKNGTHASKGISGPSNKNPVKGKYFESLDDFKKSEDNMDETGSYTKAFEIVTDDETDKEMEEAAKKISRR